MRSVRRMLAASALVFVAVLVGASLHESAHHEKYQHPERTTEIKSCLSPFLVAEEKTTCRFFACVIDAGSTGTRLHLYEFSHDINNDSGPFRVEKETFKENRPNLTLRIYQDDRLREMLAFARNRLKYIFSEKKAGRSNQDSPPSPKNR
uniref:Nucleoside-diphosphatase mig-23 n=1 Tax=Steinernema glaseri TaxID=37863 RepID=A0A1I7YX05_9BILA